MTQGQDEAASTEEAEAPAEVANAPAEDTSEPAEVAEPAAEEASAPPPIMQRLRTAAGPVAGGTLVVIEGEAFAEGCEVKVDGVPVKATFASATELSFTTLPRNLPGAVDVDVINPDGKRTMLLRSFEYCLPPVLTAIAPDHVPQSGGRATLTGADLREGSEVRIGSGRPRVDYRGPTRLDLEIGAHPAGIFDVEIVAPDGQTAHLPVAFRFDGPPRVDRVVPDRLPSGASARFVVEGEGFRVGASVYVDGVRVPSDVESGWRIVATAPARGPGEALVTVQNADGLDGSWTEPLVFEPPPGPRVTMLVPARGPLGRETPVAIVGDRFDAGCSVRVAGQPVAAKLVSPQRLEITTPPFDRAGPVDVTVVAADGTTHTLEGGFDVRAAPQLMAVQPREGSETGGAYVELHGFGFEKGCEVSFGGFPAKSDWDSETLVRAAVPARAAGAGTVDVIVRNPDEQSATLAEAFRYIARQAPTIASVEPATGPTTGGTGVLVRGDHLDLVTVVLVGGQRAANFKARGGELAFVTPPRSTDGAADLELRTADGASAVRKNAFSYAPVPPPAIRSVTPNRGAVAGGTEITIAGEHFVPGATVLVDGEPVAAVKVKDRGTISFTSPRGEDGAMVDIAVRNPTGQQAVAKRAFLYDARYR